MLQIRKGLFETNSSACHKLIVPADQSFTIPKVVNLNADMTAGLTFLYELLTDTSWGIDSWIPFLYANGVEEIKYTGDNKELHEAIAKYKGSTDCRYRPSLPNTGNEVFPTNIYLSLLFGEDTQYLRDAYDDEREPEEKDGRHFVFIWR